MCAINTQGEETHNNKPMSSAKWIDDGGDFVAVSPADECVRMLNDPFRVNGIKSEGMRAKREGKALVELNDYITYTMADVPIIPDWKISFPKGKYNGIRAYYNIRTDPDLGVGWAALCRLACQPPHPGPARLAGQGVALARPLPAGAGAALGRVARGDLPLVMQGTCQDAPVRGIFFLRLFRRHGSCPTH